MKLFNFKSKHSFTLVELLIVTLRRIKLWKGTVGISERKVPTKSEPRSFFPSISLSSSASFTLVELLIVIGILAILTAAIVLILNPAELLRQSRDTTRMSDLASIHTALSLYLTQSTQPSLGTASTIYISLPDTSPTCINLSLPTLPSGYTYACVSHASSSLINGSGWLPINLASSSISSLPKLPLDPTNTTSSGLYYTYSTNGTQYELTSAFESTKYTDKEASDGGLNPTAYELGTNTNLAPFIGGLVGWWKFDETSGTTAYDSSGYGGDGTMYASTTPTYLGTQTGCKTGGCLSFNGVDRSVSLTSAARANVTENITIGAWVNVASFVSGQAVVHKDNQFSVYIGGSGFVSWADGNNWCYSCFGYKDIGLTTNTLYFLAVTKNGSTVKIYLNGILKNSSTVVAGMGSTGNMLKFGVYAGNQAFFNGKLDDIRIYDRALSDTEIKALYDTTK